MLISEAWTAHKRLQDTRKRLGSHPLQQRAMIHFSRSKLKDLPLDHFLHRHLQHKLESQVEFSHVNMQFIKKNKQKKRIRLLKIWFYWKSKDLIYSRGWIGKRSLYVSLAFALYSFLKRDPKKKKSSWFLNSVQHNTHKFNSFIIIIIHIPRTAHFNCINALRKCYTCVPYQSRFSMNQHYNNLECIDFCDALCLFFFAK